MIIIALTHKLCVNQPYFTFTFWVNFINKTARIEIYPFTVTSPIWSLYQVIEFFKYCTLTSQYIQYFQYARNIITLLSLQAYCYAEQRKQKKSSHGC